ncbi:glycosyltransferase family 10 domain-containing protein [Roseateles sp. BYS78W]|uniref:Glycosyltransferase family 10 domain-containing protein n=1 Tax=Pelomonas candidula TaxID=3299025 RepID=A0ABW7HA50_9BURK
MSATPNHAVFIDPSSDHFLEDRLFDTSNPTLNRDGTLLPFARLREHLQAHGIPVHTADRLRDGSVKARTNHYWSLGLLNGHRSLAGRADVRLRGFILLEPPLVAPWMYRALPELANTFEQVFLHNTLGDGYEIAGVPRPRLAKLHWPQPYADASEPHWSRTDRQSKLVVIAGLHNPRRRKPEFYSSRIEAVGALEPLGAVDLYGRGWERWWTRQAASPAYWLHRRAIRSTYRGSCASKMDTLSQYRFSLCFENMPMLGYVTEKIFDCLYAGTVPVYLGAPDISTLIPPQAYIDMRDFGSNDYAAMWASVSAMTDAEWQRRREAGRDFLRTAGKTLYHDSLVNIVATSIDGLPAAGRRD